MAYLSRVAGSLSFSKLITGFAVAPFTRSKLNFVSEVATPLAKIVNNNSRRISAYSQNLRHYSSGVESSSGSVWSKIGTAALFFGVACSIKAVIDDHARLTHQLTPIEVPAKKILTLPHNLGSMTPDLRERISLTRLHFRMRELSIEDMAWNLGKEHTLKKQIAQQQDSVFVLPLVEGCFLLVDDAERLKNLAQKNNQSVVPVLTVNIADLPLSIQANIKAQLLELIRE